MTRLSFGLRSLALAASLIALLPASARAVDGSKPVAPAGGHDVTRPWVMSQVSSEVSTAKVGGLQPRGGVAPLQRAAPGAPSAPAATSILKREVLGFARADNLGDTTVGYTTWNFSLLSDVAYFGIHVNPDGTLVQTDSGWSVWQSSTASNFISTAHASGVRVLLTLMFLQTTGMCQALDSAATTISQAAAQLKGADGIDIDYEGTNQTCPDNVSLRTKLVQFVQRVRAANLGYLVIDTYASSAEDAGGFFDIPSLSPIVDAFFVMAYGLESSNGPCSLCMGPTSPLDGSAPNYTWNVTRAVSDYAQWAGQTIMGFPYYGVAGCVAGPNPPPNAPVLSPGANYTASPYTVFAALGSNPNITSLSEHRDGLDPSGQEMWATYFNSDPTVNCEREAYWDDPTSLANKYSLVIQRGLRGAGVFTLDYGGGTAGLWNDLSLAFATGSGFLSLGGSFTSSPAVASWGPNRLDVFMRGTDNALWHKWWDGTSWSIWEDLGGVLTSAPAAVSWGPNRLDVFVRGSDDALYHRWWNGSSWSWWEYQGGYQLSSGPGAVSWSQNRIDVFVRGQDTNMYHKWWDGSSWIGYEFMGGPISPSAPAPASTAAVRLDVYVTGMDQGLYHKV